MTKRNKIVLFSSILLAVCVILTSIFMLINSLETNTLNIEYIFFVILIILVSILSILVVYLSKVRKGKFEKMLNDDFYRQYEVIKDVVMNSQLSKKGKKEIVEDILEIFISAQKSGKNSQDVIGEDNEVNFANDIIKSYAKPIRLIVLNIFDGIIFFVLFIIGVNVIMWIEQLNNSFFEVKIDIAMIIFFFLIAFILTPLTKKLTSTQNPWMFMMPLAFGILFVIFAELLRKYFYNIDFVSFFLDGTIIMIPNIVVLIIYILLIPINVLLKMSIRKHIVRI